MRSSESSASGMILRNRSRVAPFITKDGSQVRELLHPKNSRIKRLSVAEARIEPGAATREHLHRSSEEVYYILKGEGEIHVGGEKARICEGDVVLIPPNSRHYVVNTQEEELIILCACSPPYSHRDTLIL